jgi:hypothetical protein
MKRSVKVIVFFAALMLAAGVAWSSDTNETVPVQSVQPSSPKPTDMPPPPPTETPAPPANDTEATTQHVAPTGQWVYTDPYGWIWMPYGDAYSYAPPNGDIPDMYVYYPTVGWCWVVAPWLWGFGPMPFFGVYGPWHFGWYGHGYGHWYGFVGHHGYHGWAGHGYWHGGRWNGYSRGSPGHQILPRGGSYNAPRGSGYRAPATHSFSSPRGFSAPHSSAMPRGGSAGRGGFSSHGGHRR